jgi:magnesium-transporting ATPase (P-type)
MILGMSVPVFTDFHVALSLIGLLSGAIVLLGMLKDRRLPGWTAVFLVTTIATSATGFLFHFTSFGPPEIVGVISLVVLAAAVAALYGYHLSGAWRSVYVVSALFALYLNAFVGVVQAFQKIPTLHALAPLGNEPPFLVAQSILLVLFVLAGILSLRRFHPMPVAAT